MSNTPNITLKFITKLSTFHHESYMRTLLNYLQTLLSLPQSSQKRNLPRFHLCKSSVRFPSCSCSRKDCLEHPQPSAHISHTYRVEDKAVCPWGEETRTWLRHRTRVCVESNYRRSSPPAIPPRYVCLEEC